MKSRNQREGRLSEQRRGKHYRVKDPKGWLTNDKKEREAYWVARNMREGYNAMTKPSRIRFGEMFFPVQKIAA